MSETYLFDEPKNVFVFKANCILARNQSEDILYRLKQQIAEGVVLLDALVELKAITGPCVEGIEVKLIREGDDNDN